MRRNLCALAIVLLVIVAALSMQDPSERPVEKQQQADQAHGRVGQGFIQPADDIGQEPGRLGGRGRRAHAA